MSKILGLVMIVKDEAHSIAATLASLKEAIDHWTILDTGSSDGTQDIIRAALDGVPGELHEEPFVDFATSRNRVLDLHGEETLFTIMVDSDGIVSDTSALRRFCEGEQGDHGAYLVRVALGKICYDLPLLQRTSHRWRYAGRVHEVCCAPEGVTATVRVPEVVIAYAPEAQSREASEARWQRDLELLQADLTSDPQSGRTAFYLAQTMECLGLFGAAQKMYQYRIRLGGWRDETYEAHFRLARVEEALGLPWPLVMASYLAAHAFDPRRAEPLYEITRHYYAKGEHALSFLFADRAASLPLPSTSMFVEEEVYAWRAADLAAVSAFYIGEHERGRQYAEKAYQAQPDDERLRRNLAFYG